MRLGEAGLSAADVREVAAAAAVALTTEGHAGKTYNLNGPEPLTGPKAASVRTQLLGREVRYAGEDMDAFESRLRQKAPAWSAFDLRMMLQGYLARGFVAEPSDVPTLTALIGHPPRRYEDFAREAAQAWKK